MKESVAPVLRHHAEGLKGVLVVLPYVERPVEVLARKALLVLEEAFGEEVSPDEEAEELIIAVTPDESLIHVEHCKLSHKVSSRPVRKRK